MIFLKQDKNNSYRMIGMYGFIKVKNFIEKVKLELKCKHKLEELFSLCLSRDQYHEYLTHFNNENTNYPIPE